jgi:exo-beta-1,3-glucanase (GH17 family)
MKRSILLLQSAGMALVFCVAQQVAPDAIAAMDRSVVTATANSSGTEPYKLRGLNFSPYTEPGENPNLNRPGQITPEEIRARLEVILPYTEWIRTFGCTDDLQPIGAMAHALGLKTAIGAWLGRDEVENRKQINALVQLAEQGHVDMAIVGSEALLRNDLTPQQLIAYILEVKNRFQTAGLAIPVTTGDVYGEFLSHPDVVAEVDVVFANYYPYWEGRSLRCALAYLHRSHEQLRTAAKGKQVIVSETGWPSCGNRKGDAVPSPENAAEYFLTFISWARANAVEYFYFAAYDEPWKALGEEGPQGACWGLWTSPGKLKPGHGPSVQRHNCRGSVEHL